ncbi:MAG: hypothetical protein ACOVQE_05105 [Chitinophagaceae bacterium]
MLLKHIKILLLNLAIVALLGVLLRYKSIFPLPFVHQKFLLHSHSHFAFTGWVTQSFYLLILYITYCNNKKNSLKKFEWLLIANLITAYGMLLSFMLLGYHWVSIFFSTLSVVISYCFTVLVWQLFAKKRIKAIYINWIKAATFFNVLASLGTCYLAYLMMVKSTFQNQYLASLYFYLHFEYNGWFSFGCLGLFYFIANKQNIIFSNSRTIYLLYLFACIPAYGLSVLWWPIETWGYVLSVLAAIAQMFALYLFTKDLKVIYEHLKPMISTAAMVLFTISYGAFALKNIFQLLTLIPFVHHFAFGIRSVIIGYLHLIFLGMTSLFLLGFMLNEFKDFFISRNIKAMLFFAAFVILNEILLFSQSIAAFFNELLPFSNQLLFIVAIGLFTSAVIFFPSNNTSKSK